MEGRILNDISLSHTVLHFILPSLLFLYWIILSICSFHPKSQTPNSVTYNFLTPTPGFSTGHQEGIEH